jgi:hypothetical protein
MLLLGRSAFLIPNDGQCLMTPEDTVIALRFPDVLSPSIINSLCGLSEISIAWAATFGKFQSASGKGKCDGQHSPGGPCLINYVLQMVPSLIRACNVTQETADFRDGTPLHLA